MFRCFDGLEFELEDVNSTSTGFRASVALDPEIAPHLASLF